MPLDTASIPANQPIIDAAEDAYEQSLAWGIDYQQSQMVKEMREWAASLAQSADMLEHNGMARHVETFSHMPGNMRFIKRAEEVYATTRLLVEYQAFRAGGRRVLHNTSSIPGNLPTVYITIKGAWRDELLAFMSGNLTPDEYESVTWGSEDKAGRGFTQRVTFPLKVAVKLHDAIVTNAYVLTKSPLNDIREGLRSAI